MKRSLFFLFLALYHLAFAQLSNNDKRNNIFGKVIDQSNGEELIGASIYIVDTNNGTITDFEGNYELTQLKPGSYQVICQYISYQTDTLVLSLSQDSEVNFSLLPDAFTLGEINLVTKVDRKEEAFVVNIQKKSAGMINTLSKKQMTITGSSNAADAVKNVSGVNIQGGKYVYVRGLSDRYSLATLNGIALPSLDPNKNSVQMDLIPANIIDNILVYKTFTADLPGDFTGGMVDVHTSDFPDSLEIHFNYSTGYRAESNLNNNFIGQEKSSTDNLGYDDGSRAIPKYVQENGVAYYSTSSFAEAFDYAQANDNQIAEMSYNEFINSNLRWEWLERTRINSNESLSEAGKSFANNWNLEQFRSGMNQSLNFSIGNKYKWNEKVFGFNSGLSYKKKFDYYEDAEIGRFKQIGAESEVLTAQLLGTEKRGDENVYGSAFANVSLHLNPQNKIKLMGMVNQNGQSSARYFEGENLSDAVGLFQEQRMQRYQERQLKTAQLSGEHHFEGNKTSELKWNLGYTKSYQNTPDMRVFTNSYEYLLVEDEETGDFYQDSHPTYSIMQNLYTGPTRYYRYLNENNFNMKADYKLKLNEANFLKMGFSYLDKTRSNQEFRYTFNSNGISYKNDNEDYFHSDNLIVGQSINGMGGNPAFINLVDNTEIKNQYTAEQSVFGAYAMAKINPSEVFETSFGLRYEQADIIAISEDTSQAIGHLKNNDFLPALNFKYHVDERNQLRASYSRTLARPSFREIAPISWFDFETNFQFVGNPNLERSTVNNFDLRWERYSTGTGLLSISAFYKKFNNPIEQVMNPQAQNVELTWRNVDEAQLLGLEFEFKKKFVFDEGEYLNIGFNTSLIQSKTKIDSMELALIRAYDSKHPDYRPMYGQAPYIVNIYGQYQKNNWSISANFNVTGQRIVMVQKGAVDVYEAPQPKLNMKLGKQLSKRAKISLSASNLLAAQYMQFYPHKGQQYSFRSFNYRPEWRVSFQVSL